MCMCVCVHVDFVLLLTLLNFCWFMQHALIFFADGVVMGIILLE